jgi:hypothetical protein
MKMKPLPRRNSYLHACAACWQRIGGREGGENGGKRVEGKELSDKKKKEVR